MSGKDAPSGPLHIDSIQLPGGGRIGLTHCPGRRGVDGAGRQWRRDLAADLAAIEAWQASAVVTLIEPHEFGKLGVPDLAGKMQAQPFDWHHVPIPDMQPPSPETMAAWREVEQKFVAAIREGGSVLVHCAAGLGRTGTMVARLLVDQFGYTPERAIETVRAHRKGTIETLEQEVFVAEGTKKDRPR